MPVPNALILIAHRAFRNKKALNPPKPTSRLDHRSKAVSHARMAGWNSEERLLIFARIISKMGHDARHQRSIFHRGNNLRKIAISYFMSRRLKEPSVHASKRGHGKCRWCVEKYWGTDTCVYERIDPVIVRISGRLLRCLYQSPVVLASMPQPSDQRL